MTIVSTPANPTKQHLSPTSSLVFDNTNSGWGGLEKSVSGGKKREGSERDWPQGGASPDRSIYIGA